MVVEYVWNELNGKIGGRLMVGLARVSLPEKRRSKVVLRQNGWFCKADSCVSSLIFVFNYNSFVLMQSTSSNRLRAGEEVPFDRVEWYQYDKIT